MRFRRVNVAVIAPKCLVVARLRNASFLGHALEILCTVEFHLRMSGSTSIMISATSLRRTAKTPQHLPLLQGGVLSVPRVHEGPQPLEPPVHGRGVPPASALTVVALCSDIQESVNGIWVMCDVSARGRSGSARPMTHDLMTGLEPYCLPIRAPLRRREVAVVHQLQRRPYSPPSGRGAWLGRAADRFPRRVSARHVLRVEAEIAQRDRGLAADVEAVHAEHHHRVGLRQLA